MKRAIWTPAPIAVTENSLFLAGEIEAYEREILANRKATETDASRFFERHPKFLHLGKAADVRREVVLVRPEADGTQRVDFFRRSYGTPFWDIVELKDPSTNIIVGQSGQHPRFTAEVDKAVSQALDYRDLIDQNSDVRERLRQKGIWVCRPQILVVVGQHAGTLPPEVLQVLYDRVRQRGPIEAWSYSDIYDFAKEHYAKNHIVTVPAFHLTEDRQLVTDALWETRLGDLYATPEALRELSPREFEELVSHLLEAFGYEVTRTPKRRDGGVDIVAVQSGIANTRLLVECKRYAEDHKIGVAQVREMLGAVLQEGMTKGLLATTGTFTQDARMLLADDRVKWVVEGKSFEDLVEWLKRYHELLRGNG